MTFKDWIAVISSSLFIVGGAGAGGKWVADQYYVNHEDLARDLNAREIRDLKREERMIEKKKMRGEAAQYELDYLEELIDDIEELERAFE